MSDTLPRSITKAMQFENGVGIGISNRWEKGQYCTIITSVGIVGCTPRARELGIEEGNTGREAVEKMLGAAQ